MKYPMSELINKVTVTSDAKNETLLALQDHNLKPDTIIYTRKAFKKVKVSQ